MTSPPPDPAWPFPSPAATLELDLADPPAGSEPDALIEPFVAVGGRGTFSRALRARLVGPTGQPLMSVVLKLQSDEYPVLPTNVARRYTNDSVSAAWTREVALLEQSGTSAGVAHLVEALARAPGQPAHLPPTLYCKRRRAFFPTRCPDCGGLLKDVQDRSLLDAAGLPAYTDSLSRYLGCAVCLSLGTGTFWSLLRDPAAPSELVGDQEALYAAFRKLAEGAVPTETPVIPCQGCAEVATCFPADGSVGAAVRRLTPLTFYEARALVLTAFELRYDEYALRLGGAGMASTAPRAQRPAFAFSQDAAGKLGLEILRLKLTMFRVLVGATAAVHRHTRAPHLGIRPDRVMVRPLLDATGLPSLWSFDLGLLGLGNAAPRALQALGAAGVDAEVYARPRTVDTIFSAPPVCAESMTEQPGTLVIRRVVRQGDGRIVLELELSSDAVDLRRLSERDLLTIVVVQGRPPLSLTCVASPVGPLTPARALRTPPLELADADLAVIRQLIDQPLTRARFAVEPCLHVPCDVYSLGMMLLTAVLANGRQSIPEVARAVKEVAHQMEMEGPERVLERLDVEGDTSPFGAGQVFADPAVHPEGALGIPSGLWREVLGIGFRCLTTLRGFSVCREWTDFDPAHPEVAAEFVLQMADRLVRQVDEALFGLPGRRLEIRSAIGRVSRELNLDGKGEVE